MNLFSFFKRTPVEAAPRPQTPPCDIDLEVDLGLFLVNGTQLGQAPASWMPEEVIRMPEGRFQPAGQGMEAGTSHGVLDYVFITVTEFAGTCSLHQAPLTLSPHMTERDILRIFGAPYWTDRSDGETLLFYEYLLGQVELQFEFPAGDGLGYVTLMREGVLSKEDQRRAYGVTRPWPPV